MWLTGVFGIATKYSEAVLSVKYRVKTSHGHMAGGPMYVIEKAMKCKWLAVLFAIFTVIASFGIGNMVQANSISTLARDTFNIPTWVSGFIMMILAAIVILGGVKSIARTCEKLVPFMAVFYCLGCLILLVLNFKNIPSTFNLIIKSAFSGHAIVGGFLGAGVKEAMRFGIARGLFSNEAGMGSAPIIAAAAQTRNAVRQALVSSTGVFWDTVVVCAITGLVIVNSGMWIRGLDGAMLTKSAFSAMPFIGPLILNVGLLTFVFSTILGWSYYGEKALEYLFGNKVIMPYRYTWVVAVLVGSIATLPMVWAFADIANALMAIPNLISLIVLTPIIISETKLHLPSELQKAQ
jgi:AGCS family alanine or glycine:cation symporter